MLESVRESAERSGIHNIETLECSADELDEGMIPFDASICRLGLMLFPSPADALQAVHRVLKPGARIAAVVGSVPAHNPFLAQPMRILLDRAGRQPPASGQPGLFALSADGVLATLLRENGLQNVQTKVARAPIRLTNAADALEMMQQAFGAYRAVVAELNEVDQTSAWADVYECLTQFEGESGFEADIEVIIGAGAKHPRGI
jgi:SAM-dependent methyltransferase